MSTPTNPAAFRSHQRLIEAATAAFAAEGYRASIDRIATHAGVARQTLYNHFPNKEALFEEVIRTAMRDVLVTLETTGEDLRSDLLHFADTYRRKVLSPAALAIVRAIAAETPRHPELARSMFAAGPARTVAHLARFLGQAMAKGELRRDDPALAAEMLIAMLTGHERLRGLMAADTDLLADERRAERVVDCFLRAYRPDRG
jgi:TetR/AcrR family transcriptional regulator, mexJK operon transcriptional repressor